MDDYTLNNPDVQLLVKVLAFKHCKNFYIPKSEWYDILQEINIVLLKSKYLERWDSSRGVNFAAYISGLVYNFLTKKQRKLRREHKLFLSLDKNLADSNGSEFSILTLLGDVSAFQAKKWELAEDIDVLFKKFEDEFKYSTCVVYVGTLFVRVCKSDEAVLFIKLGLNVFPRSISIMFWLLYRGWTQAEITEFLHVSRPWVSKKVALIREFEPFLKWAEKTGKNGR